MSIDEQHVALPKLYGAPAYARPPRPVTDTERPFDPDELPIEAYRTDDDEDYLGTLTAHTYTSAGADGGHNGHGDHPDGSGLRPRSLRLRAIAGRLLGGD